MAIYLIYWITAKLSKQLSDLSDKIDELNSAIKQLSTAIYYTRGVRYDQNTKKSG